MFPLRTMGQLEDYYYGRNAMMRVMKADEPYLSTTTGIYNPIYGQKVWSQLNQEKNLFACLPKKVWDSTGWRVITARADTPPVGGIAEDGAIPETGKPTYAQIYTKPKLVAHSFAASEIDSFLSTVDDALNPMAAAREYFAIEHAEHINKMLLQNVTTLAGNNIDSIDRMISSYSEVNGCADVDADDADVFGLNRDAGATWADAYVNHNSNTNRALSLDLIDTTLTNIRLNGGQPDLIVTGYDTLQRLQALLQAQRRFGHADEKMIVPTYNGVKGVPAEGYEGGFVVATYQGIPIIPSKDVVDDGLSRMYFIDSRYMFLRIAKPTQYFETGVSTGNPFAIDTFGDEGVYRTMAELVCVFFAAHGKLRDLE